MNRRTLKRVPLAGRLLGLLRAPGRHDWFVLTLIWILALVVAVVAMALMFVLMSREAMAAPLTAGDRVQVVIENGEGFSGKYQVDWSGRLVLPLIDAVAVSGLEAHEAAQRIANQLETQGMFRPGAARPTVQVLWWAPIDVRVVGEVYNPGPQQVNMPASRDKTVERAEELPGAYTPNRNLSDAIKAAGGITPWADLSHVGLKRNGQWRHVDLRHLLYGTEGEDPALQTDDEVMLHRMSAPAPEQVRRSGITPPGIKIYVGNLIQLQNNAPAANGIGTLTMIYGARLAQGAVSANCVGGMPWGSGDRSVLLVRTDRLSGRNRVWEVRVDDLVHKADDDNNPMLMEGDALACYDARVTGWREVFRTLTDVLMPFSIWKTLR